MRYIRASHGGKDVCCRYCGAWAVTNVSVECVASIFKVEVTSSENWHRISGFSNAVYFRQVRFFLTAAGEKSLVFQLTLMSL
jgi:hypothetical protein